MKKALILFIIVVISSLNLSYAQAGYDWGENKPDAKQRWQYLNFLVDQEQYNQAVTPLSWLIENTPQLHEDLYKLGTKVYQKVEQTEVNKAYKVALQDTVLWLFDQRIKYFGKEAYVLNRKGLVAYRYLSRRREFTDTLYALYSKIYELNKEKMYNSCAYSYMSATCDKKKFGGLGNEEVLIAYEHAVSVFEFNIQAETNPKKKESLQKKKNKLDAKLVQCADLSCDYVIEKWGKSELIAKQKLVYNVLRANKCTNSTTYLEIAGKILEAEPSAAGYNELGSEQLAVKKYQSAIGYFEKAISLSDDNDFTAALLLKIANSYSSFNKSKSREYANKVIASGLLKKKAHTLIGNLYMASYDQCKVDDDIAQRAIFIAAYNEYSLAGNTKKMIEVKKNFSSKEEIFIQNKNVGDEVTVGCWINKTVKLMTRD